MPQTSSGDAQSSDPDRPAKEAKRSGRATPKGGGGSSRAKQGRYTPPIPKEVRRSPSWYPYVLLVLLVGGILTIVLNYVNVLPGGTSTWYLIVGIFLIIAALIMATFYH